MKDACQVTDEKTIQKEIPDHNKESDLN